MLDSIVDAFFPVLEVIETETDALSILGYGMGDASHSELFDMELAVVDESRDQLENFGYSKTRSWSRRITRIVFCNAFPSSAWRKMGNYFAERPWMRPILRHLEKQRRNRKKDGGAASSYTTIATLARMTSTRRLVTSLGKLLVGKSEVIGRIQKRLSTAGANKRLIHNGYANEIEMYMGDVQGEPFFPLIPSVLTFVDHILGLQQSLAHFEKTLSQSHPAYLRYLRTQLGEAKAGMDFALVGLYAVTIGIVLMQCVFGKGVAILP
jgi:magnesium transporter